MKICILTQPLQTNYGGLLQAYALQTVLKREGYEVFTEDRRPNKDNIKNLFKVIINRVLNLIPFHTKFHNSQLITNKQRLYIQKNTDLFIKKYITTTEPIFSTNKEHFNKYNFDVYIVGSDQVWRPMYSYGIENYFLDFTKGQTVKRIAYAASFGSENWEFTAKQTNKCSSLAKSFDLITVRESSAVRLCKDYLGVTATHVLDPTMLLNKEDYESIVKAENESKSLGNLFSYILDEDNEKKLIIKRIEESCNLTSFSVMSKCPSTLFNVNNHIENCVFPAVSRWIRAFMDAEMIITDSFHGCVFSIIFNKPFWVIGNPQRGMARFDSLLSIFGLHSRLLDKNKINSNNWHEPIDWNRVNMIREKWKIKSLGLLIEELKK